MVYDLLHLVIYVIVAIILIVILLHFLGYVLMIGGVGVGYSTIEDMATGMNLYTSAVAIVTQ